MINLIPNEERKRMTTSFYYRLIVLFFAMLDFCLIVVLVGMIPSYVATSVKNNLANSKLEAEKNEPIPTPDQQTLATIKDTNNKLDLIENAEKNKFSMSQKVVNAILVGKRSDVKITKILYVNDPTTGRKISIEGTAPSREILLLFSQALGRNPTFKNVDLPISNFVKGSNIKFNLSLIPA